MGGFCKEKGYYNMGKMKVGRIMLGVGRFTQGRGVNGRFGTGVGES